MEIAVSVRRFPINFMSEAAIGPSKDQHVQKSQLIVGLPLNGKPVSYTHLDVYKRQGYMKGSQIPRLCNKSSSGRRRDGSCCKQSCAQDWQENKTETSFIEKKIQQLKDWEVNRLTSVKCVSSKI